MPRRALPRETNDDARQLRGAVAATRAYLATFGSNESLEAARAWAEDALADLSPDDAGYRGAAGVSLGKSALARGEPHEAERAYGQAAAVAQAAGLVHWTLVGTINQVSVQRVRGARRRALATGQAALAWAAERIDPVAPGMGVLSVLLADLLRDGNELAAALPLATEGLRALRLYEYSPPLAVIASLSVARLRPVRAEFEAAAAVLAEARPLVQQGPMAGLAPLLDAAEAQVQLARGNEAAAVAWASTAPPVVLRDLLRFSTHIYADGIEAVAVAVPRILADQGRASGDAALLRQASSRLEPAGELAERQGLGWLGLKTLILRALIDDGLGNRDAALAALSEAVARAEPEGYVRPFVDEGPAMAALLARLRPSQRDAPPPNGAATPAFLYRLVASFPSNGSALRSTGTESLVEPPSARERDVLRLLAAGRSNSDIAHQLVLEQSTVKTHLINLYGKLGVHSRTQAVARARELQLLD
jgi:LuxR family transcriptional regulator, maltose regulon positive regulatory protein